MNKKDSLYKKIRNLSPIIYVENEIQKEKDKKFFNIEYDFNKRFEDVKTKNKSANLKGSLQQEQIDIIKKFHDRIIQISNFDKNIWMENISECILIPREKCGEITGSKGAKDKKYGVSYVKNNKYFIEYVEGIKYSYHIIYHELLHTASRTGNEDVARTGLASYSKKYSGLGSGINEGYVELLVNRLFKDARFASAYEVETKLSAIVENVIGPSKMINYYSRARGDLLVKELTKYLPKEEVIDFLRNIDYILFNRGNEIPACVCQRSKSLRKCNLYALKLVVTKYLLSKKTEEDTIKLKENLDFLYSDKMIKKFLKINKIENVEVLFPFTYEETMQATNELIRKHSCRR